MRKLSGYLLMLLQGLLNPAVAFSGDNYLNPINYEAIKEQCSFNSDGALFIGIQNFSNEGSSYKLIVDPNTLKTQITESQQLNCVPINNQILASSGSKYQNILHSLATQPVTTTNAGIKNESLYFRRFIFNYRFMPLTQAFR